jgi:hypothetical protein
MEVLPSTSLPSLATQLIWLAILPLAIASVAWTVTHEEIFREPRDYCLRRSRTSRRLVQRKLFYVFTCEYCFSHYVTMLFIWLTQYHLLLDGWRGYLVAFFTLSAVTNIYLSLYSRLRIDIKVDRLDAAVKEQQMAAVAADPQPQRDDRPAS